MSSPTSIGLSLHEARQARLLARGGIERIIQLSHDSPPLTVTEFPGREIGSISWEGGEFLARHLLQNPFLIQNRIVVELGCGLGVAGIAAARFGAKKVFLTDRESLLPLFQQAASIHANIQCLALNWGAKEWVESGLPYADVILGADVIYTDDGALAFVETLGQALCSPLITTTSTTTNIALLAYKERGSGIVFHSALQQLQDITCEIVNRHGDHVIYQLSKRERL